MERTDLIFRRFEKILGIFILLAILVVARVVYLQFIDSERDNNRAMSLSFREVEIPAVRGNILSYDGKTLATSVPYYRVRIDCTVANDSLFNLNIDSLAYCLANFYNDKSKNEYKKEIVDGRKNGKRYLSLNRKLIDYSDLSKVKQFPLFRLGANKGGIIVEEVYKRTYPYGRRAYRTIGFINSLGTGTGIEASLDHYLKGENGKQIQQRREGGEWIPINGAENLTPQDGYDIRTTINIDFQEAAEAALKEQLTKGFNVQGGTAVVMERKSGAIRAIANLKNDGKGGFDEELNYAIGQATEPGSVLKLVTLVAILEDGKVNLSTPVSGGGGHWEYMGQRVSDSHAVGNTNVKGAFAHSSNVCFAKLATEAYSKNIDGYIKRLNDLKIGERFNIEIQGEGAATIHSAEYIKNHPGLVASMGFGYGMTLTPLHTLTFYNAIANDGKMMKPYFIESYERNGEVIKKFSPTEVSGSICSKETARMAKEALRSVVTEGTGKFIRNDRYSVSGKTGTARIALEGGGYERNGMRRYQATFCGYFPSEDPLYTIIVVLYSGETAGSFYGATQAGPPFRHITDFIYANSPELNPVLDGKKEISNDAKAPSIATGLGNESAIVISQLPIKNKNHLVQWAADKKWVKFSNDSSQIKISGVQMFKDSLVDVRNMGLKDAIFILENQGYKVKFSGKGRVVEQSGVTIDPKSKDKIIYLTLGESL